MRRLIFLLVLFFSLPAFSQAKHPFTFEDMMKLKRVGEPVPSPDGKWVLFAAVDVDLAANTKTSHIWIADFDGATGTVTHTYELTAVATEADGELWSPDGKNILFVSNVYPECDGDPVVEARCNRDKLRQARNSQVSAQIFTRLLYRHWNRYKENRRSHLFVTTAPGIQADITTTPSPPTKDGLGPQVLAPYHDLTPGDYNAPVFSLGGQDDYAFSPDGQEICYTSNHDKVEATSTNNDLWTVPVNWGFDVTPAGVLAKTKNITADNPASDSTPLYSPYGKYIAYRAQQRPGYESDRFRLMLYDRRTGEKKDLTETFDHWVGSFAWAPDSKTIYFSAEHLRHSLIYAVGTTPVSGTTSPVEFPRRALVGGFDDDVTVTPDGKNLIFTRMSLTAPIEIYAADAAVDGCPARTGDVDRGKGDCSLSKDRAVTHINDKLLSQVLMSNGEAF